MSEVYFYPTKEGWACTGPDFKIYRNNYDALIKAYLETNYAKQSLARSPAPARKLPAAAGVGPQPTGNSPEGHGETSNGTPGNGGQPESGTPPVAV